MTILSVILNRSLQHLAPEIEPKGYESAPQQVKTVYDQIRFLVEQEEKNLKILNSLKRQHHVLDIGLVPEMETDIHDLTSLHKLAKFFL